MAEHSVPLHQAELSDASHFQSLSQPMSSSPTFEMVPNPDFKMPPRPHTALTPTPSFTFPGAAIRPASMHGQRSRSPVAHHRKTASNLPTFNFNAADASGLKADDDTPSPPPDEPAPSTPSSRHRRNNSEFVGGDSRLGVTGAISSSPVKSNAPASAARPKSHQHRRSVAVSGHDLSSIMGPVDPQPRLSTSLPTTPLDHPSSTIRFDHSLSTYITGVEPADPFGPALEDAAPRPPSRTRVEFSERVEIIPRPLSTISSETESSISTIRGHSVNNSISSVLSLSTPSPPSARLRPTLLETTFEDASRSRLRSSLEISKRTEKEGDWPKANRPHPELTRPVSESGHRHPKISFAPQDSPTKPPDFPRKKQPVSQAFDWSRRGSEPTIATIQSDALHHSAASLQDGPGGTVPLASYRSCYVLDQRSSTKKIRDWAVSRIARMMKDHHQVRAEDFSMHSPQSVSVDEISAPGRVPSGEGPVAESDLDAVFTTQTAPILGSEPTPRIEIYAPVVDRQLASRPHDGDDQSPMLDLDEAIPPPQNPPGPSHRRRDHLHSSRLTKDFNGPGGHYFPPPNHRRTESAPALMPFERRGMGIPIQPTMADVFEEDEEDNSSSANPARASRRGLEPEEPRLGIHTVVADCADSPTSSTSPPNSGQLAPDEESSPQLLSTSHHTIQSDLPTMASNGRAPLIVDDPIVEGNSPAQSIEIVLAHEEPRASSLTKSSDSSGTPTILATQPDDMERPSTSVTSEFYPISSFSSPDISRFQGSYENSRLGTSTSSITDNRTMSSYTTGDHGLEVRQSVDDVPSLTSSRSTMISTSHANSSRRDICGTRTPSIISSTVDSTAVPEVRRKRASIQSLSQLVGGSFGPKPAGIGDGRPQTAAAPNTAKLPRKRERRLRKLMFWKPKHKQDEESDAFTPTSTTA